MQTKKILIIGFLLGLGLAFIGCSPEDQKEKEAVVVETEVSCRATPHIIEPEALLTKLENGEKVFLIEVSKPEQYLEGHISGAHRIWRPDYANEVDYPFGGMRSTPDAVARLLSDLGYAGSKDLVLYDRRGDVDAARFLWLLNKYGFSGVALLNGGIDAWIQKGLPVSKKEEASPAPGHFVFQQKEGETTSFIGIDEIQDAIKDPEILLVDTRTTDEYMGVEQKKGAFRAGRIPGSIHFDWILTVDYDGDYAFKSCEEIEPMLVKKGITPDKRIITYCHSGVRSAHLTFVLTEIMGYPHVENYDGSWTEWSYHKELPLTSDSKTITTN